MQFNKFLNHTHESLSSGSAILLNYLTKFARFNPLMTIVRKKVIIIILFITVLSYSYKVKAQADVFRTGDSLALVSVYTNANGQNWTNKSGWLTNTPITNWHGVTTTQIGSSLRVTGLSLPNNNLVGILATSALVELQVLNVRDNPLLTGTGYSNNKKLKWIDAGNTKMGLPNDIGTLSELEVLNLDNNQIVQPGQAGGAGLPSSLFSLTKLIYLNLRENLFTGSIPTSIGNLVNLEVLALNGNLLTGDIPPSIGGLTKLKFLALDNNVLTGPIPTQLSNLTNLAELYLNSNQLNGSIPTFIGNFALLEKLDLGANQFTGTISTQLNNLSNLKFLSICTNQLSGTLPSNFLANSTQLETLFICNNNFTGNIPVSCLSSPKLTYAAIFNGGYDGLPDIHTLPVFSNANSKVEVQGNLLTFEDLEPNRNIASTKFIYSPQLEITANPITVIGQQPISISFTVGGSANSYQWQKNGVNISGANSSSYTKASASLADAGVYTLVVTNSLVPSLTIKRHISVTIDGTQSITFDPLPSKTYNNAPFVLTATASSGLLITYVSSNTAVASINGNILTIEGAGTCTITAKQAGNAGFNAAPDVLQTFIVSKAAQSLVANFLSIPRLTTDLPFDPQAFYNSGLPATISSSNMAVATVSGNLITPVSAGVTTLTVSQPGDNNFLPATNSTFSLTVNNPTQSPYKFTLQGGNPVTQLSFPLSNLEVDASGKIYAINPSLAQIIILNPDGSFNKSFGSFGTKDGELNNPSDVAIDGSGNMYVVDAGNHRIQVFDSNGTFIRKFGSIGAASGKLSTPNSLALDGNGNVFIVERMGRVSVFTTNGVWQRSFGSSGSGPGQLSVPRGIDLDSSGNVYVVDAGNGRVVVYASNGTYLRTIGTNGSANGQLDGPKYVKLDGAGNVIVTNDFNARVEVFANNGNFLANFPWPGGLTGACGIARDGSGNIYISNYNTNELLKFSPSGTLLQTIMPLQQTTLQVFQPSGLAFDVPGNVYVSSASKNVRVYASNGAYLRTIGAPGTADGQFSNGPGKIAVDASGNTYVADLGNNRVQVFDNTGAFIRKVGVGLLNRPVGLAIDASGDIYVADQGNNKIQVFQNNGTFKTSFGTAGAGNGQFGSPAGVAVDGSGNIYVADGGNNRIQVFTNSGSFIRAFGAAGSGNGQFNLPYDIKLDGNGNIFVADRNNHRVQVFKNDGTFLYNVGSLGYGSLAGNGHLYGPVSVAVNPSGLTIGVADFNNNLIQAFGSPDINLKQTGSIVSNGSYNFGNINMLSSSSVTPFTVENLGSAVLNLTGNPKVSLSGANASDFVVNSSGTTAAIQPGGSTTFTVTFTPSAVGTRVAQLTIVSDDLDESPYLINLTGTGVKLNQTITFNTLATKAFGDPAFNLTATASSALAVTYASSNPLVATVSGSTVTIMGVGSTIITASQAGNGNYNAATNVPQTLTVNKANQVINFSAIAAKTFNDPAFTLTGSATSGLSVTYASSNTSVATISGNIVTVVGAGTSVITASQTGNANYNAAAPVPQTLTVNKANQTITFNSLSPVSIGDSPFNLNATSSSGLTVTYTSSNNAVATISGNTVTIVGQGNTTITAIQSGNGNYNAATSVDQVLTVKQGQSISFAALPAKIYGDAPFIISATSSSTLPVSFSSSNGAVATISGNTVTIVGAGVTTITASQAGNITFNAAPDATQLLTVNKAEQIITFGALSDRTLGDASFTLNGSASSNLSVTYTTLSDKVSISGNQVTLVKPGRVTVTANQAGNANFNPAATIDQSFCIKPAKPTISITNENTESPTLTSNSSTGNQWYLNGSAIASATNATLNITAAGVYKVQVKADDCISEFSVDFPIIVTGDLPKRGMAVTVLPNPVEDVLEIRGLEGEIKSFQLLDLTGRTASFEVERNPSSYSASVRHLAQGMYILRVQVASELHQIKFIKK